MTFKEYFSQNTKNMISPGVQSRHMHPILRDVQINAKYPGRVVPHYLRSNNNRIQKIENIKKAIKGVDYDIHKPKALKGIPSVTLEYNPQMNKAGLRKN